MACGLVGGASSTEEALRGWDPRRGAALERAWEQFRTAGAGGVSLSEELIAGRRREAAAQDAASPPAR